jgi:hemerythrin
MNLISWKKQYSVGVETLDFQHKQLIAIINELCQAENKCTSHQRMGEIIEELVAYTKFHFKHEESYFNRINFLAIDEHKAEHAQFAKEISQFEERHKAQLIEMNDDILNYLKTWLLNHILVSDKKYAALAK